MALYFVSMSSLYSRNKFTGNTFQKQSSWGVLQKVLLEEFHKTHWKNLQWSPLCVCVFSKVLFIKRFSEFWDECWTPAKRAASRICKLTIKFRYMWCIYVFFQCSRWLYSDASWFLRKLISVCNKNIDFLTRNLTKQENAT